MKLGVRKQTSAFGSMNVLIFGVLGSIFLYNITYSVISRNEVSNGREYVKEFFIFLSILILLFVAYLSRKILDVIALKKRRKRLVKHVMENNLYISYKESNDSYDSMTGSTLMSLGERDKKITNHYSGKDWAYFDYEYAIYKKTKHGEFKAYTLHYAVAEFDLPRKLPNIFFDSSKSGGREIKNLLASSQLHSLEGDFDNFFDTYFSENYTVDSMSFISPEVMQALKQASFYDIEIFKDKLYLYAELRSMPHQIVDMQKKGVKVREKLLKNIKTYRDERIGYKEGRETVALEGMKLDLSYKKFYFMIALGIASIFFATVFLQEFEHLTFFGALLAISGFGRLRRAKRENDYEF